MCASAACAAVAAACGASTAPVSTTTTTMAPLTIRETVIAAPIRNDDAIERVTAARCGREVDCRNIGFDRTWTSYDGCTRDVRGAMRNTLGSGCARGVGPLALQDCVDATRSQPCAPPTSAGGRIVSQCSSSSLCL
jgi:hypothetical protein